jgi:WD40 repeat protein/acylphosphatase
MAVTACDLSHDAHYLATASVDGTVRVWSLSDDPDAAIVAGMRRHHGVLIGEPTAEAIRLQLGADAVGGNELEMEVKGRDVVSAAPRTVRVRTGDVRGWIADPAVLAGPDMAVTGCAFVDVDPGVRAWSLLWWSADRTARLWGDDGSSVVFEGHAETVRHAGSVPPAFARVLEREDVESLPVFVTASDDRSIGVWDRSGRRLSVLDGRGTEARVLAALNHSEAFVLYNDGAFQLTDARRGDQERNFYASSESGQPMGYATTVDDDAAVTWWGDGKLGFSDADSDGRLALIQAHEGVVLAVAAGRSSPPRMADFTVSGGSDHRAIVWGLATHEAWFTLEHDGPVAAVAIDRTGDHLVAGSWDGTVSVGDVKQRALRHVLRGHTDRVHACTFVRLDTGGRAEVVVSAGADRTLRVWDVEDARELRVLRGHTAEVAGLVSVGGGIVVSWSLDRTLRVWDVAAGAQRAALHGHTDIITHAAMLDEHILLSSALDGTVRAWDTDLGVPLGVLRGTRPFVKVCALRGGARGEPPLGVALDEAGEAWVFEYAAPATPEVREAERASVAASEGEVLSVRGRKERRPGKTARTGASRVGAAPVSRTFVVRGAVQGTGFRAWANAQFPELGVTGSAENQPDGTVIVQAEGAPAALDRLRERLEEGPPMARIDAVKEAKAAKAQPRAKTSRRSRRSPRKK